ncbi:SapC family protein [Sedimentimonas flavescens]|uniref:SapC family protein n=1 Tax=Sedimentimonas flavescens TaxID=2851012 RepID=A0ABT3A1A2_9RHOB|nr:SapC family protein [Sedimentimonas flavescens]MBW0158068.1 SapC family protein [Sedimentimonas flavescens]MCT2539806.1 SapC family protein [Sedimentimonas flavescens]MCV2879762.1 SapC family protein [Sedimentimonas flavescens]WBL33299.1 SapC family protein [Sinirhodobacter sp. HNIBRBA609]
MSTHSLLADAVPLTPERHGSYSLATGEGYAAFRTMNVVPVLVDEFAALAHDYVIGFLKQGDGFAPAALLGLAENENLYVGADGRWKAEYVPAILRQQPFVARRSKDGKKGVLCISESHPGLNTEGEGAPLFDEDGRPGDLVSRAQQFVSRVAQGALRTESFCARLADLNLLSPIRTEMKRADGTVRAMRGVFAINREALDKLPAKVLGAMQKDGSLEAIHLHLYTLRNLNSLANRIQTSGTGPLN